MFDISDDVKSNYRPVKKLDRPAPRRWSVAEKAAVIRETLVPGACIPEVARRWQVDSQQVYRWRHSQGVTHRGPMKRHPVAAPSFVPIVTEAMAPVDAASSCSATPIIEIQLAGAVVRVTPGLDDAQLTMVLRAVRASASSS